MMEEPLLQYGTLGIWTIVNITLLGWFMKNQNKREEKLIQVIENNTQVLSLCHARNKRL